MRSIILFLQSCLLPASRYMDQRCCKSQRGYTALRARYTAVRVRSSVTFNCVREAFPYDIDAIPSVSH